MIAIYSFDKCRNLLYLTAGVILLAFGCKNPNSASDSNLPDSGTSGLATNEIRFDSSLYKFEDGYIKLEWDMLLKVKFEKQYNEDLGFEVDMPVFSDTLLALNGREVIAEGFYIPVDETGDESILILSAYPFAQCFFCGAAGAESVIDVLNIGKLPKMIVDQKIRFKGRFRLNKDNFDFLIYVLEQAEYIS